MKRNDSQQRETGKARKGSEHNEVEIYSWKCRWLRCPDQFDSALQGLQHCLTCHVGKGRPRYTCWWAFCYPRGHVFLKRQHLVNHLHSLHHARPYSCPICGRPFSRKDLLADHTGTHCAVKPFKCSYPACDAMFAHPRSVAKHIKKRHPTMVVTTVATMTQKIKNDRALLHPAIANTKNLSTSVFCFSGLQSTEKKKRGREEKPTNAPRLLASPFSQYRTIMCDSYCTSDGKRDDDDAMGIKDIDYHQGVCETMQESVESEPSLMMRNAPIRLLPTCHSIVPKHTNARAPKQTKPRTDTTNTSLPFNIDQQLALLEPPHPPDCLSVAIPMPSISLDTKDNKVGLGRSYKHSRSSQTNLIHDPIRNPIVSEGISWKPTPRGPGNLPLDRILQPKPPLPPGGLSVLTNHMSLGVHNMQYITDRSNNSQLKSNNVDEFSIDGTGREDILISSNHTFDVGFGPGRPAHRPTASADDELLSYFFGTTWPGLDFKDDIRADTEISLTTNPGGVTENLHSDAMQQPDSTGTSANITVKGSTYNGNKPFAGNVVYLDKTGLLGDNSNEQSTKPTGIYPVARPPESCISFPPLGTFDGPLNLENIRMEPMLTNRPSFDHHRQGGSTTTRVWSLASILNETNADGMRSYTTSSPLSVVKPYPRPLRSTQQLYDMQYHASLDTLTTSPTLVDGGPSQHSSGLPPYVVANNIDSLESDWVCVKAREKKNMTGINDECRPSTSTPTVTRRPSIIPFESLFKPDSTLQLASPPLLASKVNLLPP